MGRCAAASTAAARAALSLDESRRCCWAEGDEDGEDTGGGVRAPAAESEDALSSSVAKDAKGSALAGCCCDEDDGESGTPPPPPPPLISAERARPAVLTMPVPPAVPSGDPSAVGRRPSPPIVRNTAGIGVMAGAPPNTDCEPLPPRDAPKKKLPLRRDFDGGEEEEEDEGPLAPDRTTPLLAPRLLHSDMLFVTYEGGAE